MTGSSAMTRRTSSRRTGWVSSKSAPARANVRVNRPVISAEMAAKKRGQPAPGAAEIGSGEDDAGADDADADLAGAGDCEHEGAAVRAAGRAKLVARDDRGRIAGQCRRIGREIVQKRRDESAAGAPQRQADQKRRRGPAESTRSAPRSPRRPRRCRSCGTTLAQRSAEMRLTDDRRRVPAQNALSSSSQNAT